MGTLPQGCWKCCTDIKWLVENRKTRVLLTVDNREITKYGDPQHHPVYSAPIKLVGYKWVPCTCGVA